jgi:hypothetical protein
MGTALSRVRQWNLPRREHTMIENIVVEKGLKLLIAVKKSLNITQSERIFQFRSAASC